MFIIHTHIYNDLLWIFKKLQEEMYFQFEFMQGGAIGGIMQTGVDMLNMLAVVPHAIMCQGLV